MAMMLGWEEGSNSGQQIESASGSMSDGQEGLHLGTTGQLVGAERARWLGRAFEAMGEQD